MHFTIAKKAEIPNGNAGGSAGFAVLHTGKQIWPSALPVATYITRTVSNKERVDIINLSCMSDSQDIFLDLLQTLPGFDTSEEGKN